MDVALYKILLYYDYYYYYSLTTTERVHLAAVSSHQSSQGQPRSSVDTVKGEGRNVSLPRGRRLSSITTTIIPLNTGSNSHSVLGNYTQLDGSISVY